MVKINIKECQKYNLDANSLLFLSIIESQNVDDWNWLGKSMRSERFQFYINYLLGREFILCHNPEQIGVLSNYRLHTTKKKSKKAVDDSEFGKFVDQFYELWPKGIKSGGYAVRSGKNACSTKLRTFLKENKLYTTDIVLAATKNYIDKCRANDYQYMKLAPYFIIKDGVSVLESYCDEVANGTVKVKSMETRL